MGALRVILGWALLIIGALFLAAATQAVKSKPRRFSVIAFDVVLCLIVWKAAVWADPHLFKWPWHSSTETAASTVANTSNSPNEVASTAPAATNQTDTTSETTSMEPSMTSSEASGPSQDANKYIPGLNLEDVKLNLQNTWGLQFSMSSGQDGAPVYHGEKVDPDTGAKLTCDIYFDSVTQVIMVNCAVDGTGVMGVESSSNISNVAAGFLGYCATLPYDKAQPQAAKAWVQSAVKGSSGEVTKTISGVQFRVTRSQWMKTLQMSNQNYGK